MGQAVRHKGEMGAIKSAQDLDAAIARIGRLDIELEEINNELTVTVQEAKEKAEEAGAPLRVRHVKLRALAQTYVETNRVALLGTKKSFTGNYGQIGFRKKADAVPLPKKNSPEMIELLERIELLQSLAEDEEEFRAFVGTAADEMDGVPQAIVDITPIEERYVPAAAVRPLTNNQLELLGLHRDEGGDVFFVQPDREQIEAMEGANADTTNAAA